MTDMTSLAVDNTGMLYASGHPATPGGATQTVGLLRSSNGGLTWQPVKGADSDDFHALTARGSTIIGESEGHLWVSTDGGEKWQRSGPSSAGSLTLDSRDLWITGTQGLERARIDGTAAETVQDAPRLILGSLTPDKTVWGVDTTGTLWMRDIHEHWHQVGTLTPGATVTALTGIDAHHAALATSAGITWITVTDPVALPTTIIA